jgi:hypothetical protein
VFGAFHRRLQPGLGFARGQKDDGDCQGQDGARPPYFDSFRFPTLNNVMTESLEINPGKVRLKKLLIPETLGNFG